MYGKSKLYFSNISLVEAESATTYNKLRDEVEVCMMIKDSIDDEKVNRQKQFDRFCYNLGGVK